MVYLALCDTDFEYSRSSYKDRRKLQTQQLVSDLSLLISGRNEIMLNNPKWWVIKDSLKNYLITIKEVHPLWHIFGIYLCLFVIDLYELLYTSQVLQRCVKKKTKEAVLPEVTHFLEKHIIYTADLPRSVQSMIYNTVHNRGSLQIFYTFLYLIQTWK